MAQLNLLIQDQVQGRPIQIQEELIPEDRLQNLKVVQHIQEGQKVLHRKVHIGDLQVQEQNHHRVVTRGRQEAKVHL